MFDFDLAALYEVETRVFNQAIKRNIDSFPEDFMFQLTKEEWTDISSQIVMSSADSPNNQSVENLKSQIVISSWGGLRKLPYVFTEHGVTMAQCFAKLESKEDEYHYCSCFHNVEKICCSIQ